MMVQAATGRAPIAVFVYRRPLHADRLIDSLLANEEVAGSPLFVFCDGARGDFDLEGVTATRRVVRERLGNLATIIEREENRGLAVSIIEGVTDLSRRYGKVIVLEDDLMLHSDCIAFLNAALRQYANEHSIYHVNAYRYPIPKGAMPCLSRLPSSWGWGTWERAWAAFEADATALDRRIRRENLVAAMDFGGKFPFHAMLRDQAAGRIDSWAIRWYASVLLRRGLAVYPDVSQVLNGGMDNSGEHCGVESAYDVEVGTANRSWPVDLTEDELTYRQMQAFFDTIRAPLLRRISRDLQRKLLANWRGVLGGNRA
jgi:hypothetical protein